MEIQAKTTHQPVKVLENNVVEIIRCWNNVEYFIQLDHHIYLKVREYGSIKLSNVTRDPNYVTARIRFTNEFTELFGIRSTSLGRFVCYLEFGLDMNSDKECNHIDYNPRNNVLSNLEVTTKPENNRRKEFSRKNTTGMSGVNRDHNSFKATRQYRVNGKKGYDPLGSFKSPIPAGLSVDIARLAKDEKYTTNFLSAPFDPVQAVETYYKLLAECKNAPDYREKDWNKVREHLQTYWNIEVKENT